MAKDMFGPSVDVLVRSLNFLEARHKIIADNIANANTPFYKAKSAPIQEFRQALADAIEARSRHRTAGLKMSDTRHIRTAGTGLVVDAVEAPSSDASVLRHDGNNVSLEREMADLAENTIAYRAMSDLLRKQFAMLQTAIRERVD